MSDKEWAKKVYKKAEAKAEEYKLTALADTIYENLDDKEWEKKVYKKAEKRQTRRAIYQWTQRKV